MVEQTEDYKTNITKHHDRADTGFRIIKLTKPTSQNFMVEQTEYYKTNITKLHGRADRVL